MVDSTSLLTAAGSVLKHATSLYGSISSAMQVGDSINSHLEEVRRIQRMCRAIVALLLTPDLQAFQGTELWEDAVESLEVCDETLQKFESLLDEPSSFGDLKTRITDLALSPQEQDIVKLQSQLQTHNAALNVILEALNVHIASTAPELVAQQMMPMLATLTEMIDELETVQKSQENDDYRMYESGSRLRRSAQLLVSRVSAMVMNDARWHLAEQAPQVQSTTLPHADTIPSWSQARDPKPVTLAPSILTSDAASIFAPSTLANHEAPSFAESTYLLPGRRASQQERAQKTMGRRAFVKMCDVINLVIPVDTNKEATSMRDASLGKVVKFVDRRRSSAG